MKFFEFEVNDNSYRVPMRYTVCWHCSGEGTIVNPAIDGNGITAEEMDELGEDFRTDYLTGVYDIRCITCDGERVIEEVDLDKLSSEEGKAYFAYISEEQMYLAEVEMERRMGA